MVVLVTNLYIIAIECDMKANNFGVSKESALKGVSTHNYRGSYYDWPLAIAV